MSSAMKISKRHWNLMCLVVLFVFLLSADNANARAEPLIRSSKESTHFDFISNLFDRYGNQNVLEIDNFQKMLHNLGIGASSTSRQDRVHSQHGNTKWHSSGCLAAEDIFKTFKINSSEDLNTRGFSLLCPILLDQLEANSCQHKSSEIEGHSDHETSHEDHDHRDEHHHPEEEGMEKTSSDNELSPYIVWLHTFVSVLFISLCSRIGIAFVPNARRVVYNHVLQFLVAVAIGTLSGDSFLHLLPHAMTVVHKEEEGDGGHEGHGHGRNETHSESEKDIHLNAMYKGFVALAGVYGFFFLERLFTIFTNSWNIKKKMLKEQKNQERKENGSGVNIQMASPKVDKGHSHSCNETVMVVHPNKALKSYADASHDALLHQCDESIVQSPSTSFAGDICTEKPAEGAMNKMVEAEVKETHMGVDAEIVGVNSVEEREPRERHEHGHSHSSRSGGPLSYVAMMIIIGDAIHNLCGGLAIGATFSKGTIGGISTSLAVLCHGLPHEIGDYTVMLRSGLLPRKAMMYSIASSLPSVLGAVIGVLVGSIGSASSWIFSGIAGMFLYITLVDLVPEITSVYTKPGEPWFFHLLLQAGGITFGATLTLILGVLEVQQC